MSYKPGKNLPEDQIGEVGGNIIRALPDAMRILQNQGIVTSRQAAKYVRDLPHLSCAIAAMFKGLYNGHADIATLLEKHYIDCGDIPNVPEGWGLTKHKRSGRLLWDSERQGRALLLPQDRDHRDDAFDAGKVIEQIYNLPVLNANVLDSLLAGKHPIPEQWEEKEIFFAGTLYYADGRGAVVRGLYKRDGRTTEREARLIDVWNKHLIALRA